jgi:hypothetical protein
MDPTNNEPVTETKDIPLRRLSKRRSSTQTGMTKRAKSHPNPTPNSLILILSIIHEKKSNKKKRRRRRKEEISA